MSAVRSLGPDVGISEAQFKTLKYRPEFPDRFGSPEHGLSVCRALVHWYNHEHYHSTLGYLTPAIVHQGRAETVLRSRTEVLDRAYAEYPERFVRKSPEPPRPPAEVWINRPERGFEVDLGRDAGAPGAEEVVATVGKPSTCDPRQAENVAQGASGEADFGSAKLFVGPTIEPRAEMLSPERNIR